MKNTWGLIIGLVLGAIAAFLVHQRLSQDPEDERPVGRSYARLKPDSTISKGDQITWSKLQKVSLPPEFKSVSAVAVRHDDNLRLLLANNTVRSNRDLDGGAILLHEHLTDDPAKRFAMSIGETNRAVTIPVSEISSVAYFVEPESRVDVLITVPRYDSDALTPLSTAGFGGQETEITPESIAAAYRPSPVGLVTKTLLQNMRVLAVGRATSRGAYRKSSGGYRSITLDVTPEEAELLTFAMTQTQGGLNLVLRNPINTEQQKIEEVDWEDLK